MIFAYSVGPRGLQRLGQGADLSEAVWIDLYRPLDSQSKAVEALGVEVPTLADMEEIEISNRIYREDGVDYMTVVLPGLSTTKTSISGPVAFVLTPRRLVTVRHHAPRPFETFPERADKAAAGWHTPERVFLGLVEDIVSRFADLLEGSGRALDTVSGTVFAGGQTQSPETLQSALRESGLQGELIGRVRIGIMTLERALSFFAQTLPERADTEALKSVVKSETRDLQSLTVHADFLSARVGLAVDATLGMINLAQNSTVRIVSVVAALFMPPTMVASIYGMNFHVMPELDQPWGYPAALMLMAASAGVTFLFFKWKKWL